MAAGIHKKDAVIKNALNQHAEPQFPRTTLSNVADDLAKADKLFTLVAKAGNYHVRPEPRSILPYPPAFIFKAASFPRHAQFMCRLARVEIVLRIEESEVLADDFLCLVLLQPLGPGVPGGDSSFRIKKEDGIIRDRIHQKTKDFRRMQAGLGINRRVCKLGGHVLGTQRLLFSHE